MSPRLPADSPTRPIEVAIVGNDAVLAALPARPMQLAHAIHACGYDLVVPVSWGEEALAEHALRVIAARGSAPAIFCACPSLRSRLLSAGSELAPYLISTVAPSVATARYLRALQPDAPMRITMIGGCPGARDASIDTRVSAHDFLRLLVNRGISLTRQPAVFDSVIPPDRRRFFSLPGGSPSPKALETRAPERRLVTVTDETFSTELAELLLGGQNILIDLSSRLGCTCCGGIGVGEHWGPAGPDEIMQYEPPRAPTPVLDLDVEVPLDMSPIETPGAKARGERAGARGAAGESIRLPGAAPIAEARQRAERRRIAVTPPAAMPVLATVPTAPAAPDVPLADAPARPAPPSVAPLASAPSARQARTATTAPVAASRLASSSAGMARSDEDAPPPRRVAPVPEPLSPSARPDVAVSRQVQAEPATMPGVRHARDPDAADPGAPSPASSLAPTTAAPAASVAPLPSVERSADVPAEIPVAVATPEPEHEALFVRTRRSAPDRFHLSRAARHPRAQSGSGRVLPRAYIRHTPSSVRASAEAPTPAHVDEERALDFVVEPTPTPRSDAADGGAAPFASPPLATPTITDSPSVAPVAPVARVARVAPPPDAPTIEQPVVRTISAEEAARNEVLARVRQQAQRPTRVLVHDTHSQRGRRVVGSLTFFVATAAVVVTALVALVLYLRRSPRFPF